MAKTVMTYGNGHYVRRGGVWCYARTEEPVPGAEDVRLNGRTVMAAPELHPDALLTIEQAAEMCGVKPESWRRMTSRGQCPEPVLRFGSSPVWTRPILDIWMARRPGRGGRTAA